MARLWRGAFAGARPRWRKSFPAAIALAAVLLGTIPAGASSAADQKPEAGPADRIVSLDTICGREGRGRQRVPARLRRRP
jgi:hypothetical protein